MDANPILESLAFADFIRTIDGHRITDAPERPRQAARWVLATYVWPPLLLFVLRALPPRLTLPLLRRAVRRADVDAVERVARAVATTDLGKDATVATTGAFRALEELLRADPEPWCKWNGFASALEAGGSSPLGGYEHPNLINSGG